MINNKDNLEDQISNLKGKITACTQEILAETGNKEFNGMRMRAIWELIETTIIPIITYGSESWEPTKGEMEQIETIFNKALKTIVHLPQQTPTAILLAETGFHSIELYINRRLNYACKQDLENGKRQTDPNYNKQRQSVDRVNRTAKGEIQYNERANDRGQGTPEENTRNKEPGKVPTVYRKRGRPEI